MAPPLAAATAHQTLPTGWGDTLEIVRDTAFPEPPAPPPARHSHHPSVPPLAPTSSPSASPSTEPVRPGKSPRASPAVLRTHTLVMRPPFAPLAPVRRLNATDADWNPEHRSPVLPLLTASGDVDVLVYSEPNELLVSGDRVNVLPAFPGTHPYDGRGDVDLSGVTLPGGHALVLGDWRRRLTLEEHGPGAPTPPVYLGLPRERPRRRPLVLARRDDGALGVLVLDGGASGSAGVAPYDPRAAAVSRPTRLAPWSAMTTADDPRCRKGEDRGAYRAIVVIDPSLWLALDPTALPGLKLAPLGMMLVRWGVDRVCLEGLDVGVLEPGKERGEAARWISLVARWGPEKTERSAALRAVDLRQELVCAVAPAAANER